MNYYRLEVLQLLGHDLLFLVGVTNTLMEIHQIHNLSESIVNIRKNGVVSIH